MSAVYLKVSAFQTYKLDLLFFVPKFLSINCTRSQNVKQKLSGGCQLRNTCNLRSSNPSGFDNDEKELMLGIENIVLQKLLC